MPLKLMIFPATVVRSGLSGAFLPWCGPLVMLEPPSLGEETPGELEQAGLVERVKPAGGLDQSGERGRDIIRLLHEWQDWTRQHAGDGSVEAIKAGVEAPPPPETVRGLAGEIKRFGQGGKDHPAPPPEVTADLMLHLAHVRDRQAAEMEGMLAGVEREHQELGEVLGLTTEDSAPADYQEIFYQRLPPMSYTMDDQRQLPQRLAAWATLAGPLGQGEGGGDWLATDSLAAVQLLLERANRRLNPAEGVRSAAGVLMPGPGPMPLPTADSPQAQEAARLVLPGLGRLDQAGMASAAEDLARAGGLEELRAGMGGMLSRLAAEPWSAQLKAELEAEAKDLANGFADLVQRAGLETNGEDRGLSILAFPGLSREQVLQLMRKDQPQGLPGLDAWPNAWPQGSTPVVVGW